MSGPLRRCLVKGTFIVDIYPLHPSLQFITEKDITFCLTPKECMHLAEVPPVVENEVYQRSQRDYSQPPGNYQQVVPLQDPYWEALPERSSYPDLIPGLQ